MIVDIFALIFGLIILSVFVGVSFWILKNIPKWIVSTKNETIPFWIGFFKNQFIEFKKNWKTLFEKK